MSKPVLAALAIALTLSQSAPALAQLPPGVFAGERDYGLAPAGAYALDPDHTAVVAKVSHIGYSLSVFRFDKVTGTLNWNPARPAGSSLKIAVDTASISTPVPGFAAQLAGDDYLKSAAFPQAIFVSTQFHQLDATHGRVDGQFTLMGKTVPLTFDVELIGAGKGFMGHPRIGAEATTQIHPQDFGMAPMFGGSIQLVIDAEFAQTS
jgi:polyisoprenoid-binding protein YceI